MIGILDRGEDGTRPKRTFWRLSRGGVLLVVACVAATVLLRMAFQDLLRETSPLVAFVLPVTICAALGGFWVGALATLLSTVVGTYFFLDPLMGFDSTISDDVARVVLFMLIGLVISGVSGRMHSEIARTVEAERRVAAREALLREANARMELTLDAAGAGTWDWDVIHDKLVWSKTNYALYGLDPETTSIKSLRDWLDTLLQEDRAAQEAQVQQLLQPSRQDLYRTEFRILHPQKGERWILRLGRIDRDDRGRPKRLHGINVDITDRKRAEESERAARSEAERLNRMKDEFVATISHELRTPLTAILGWVQILKRPQRDLEKLDRGLTIIERNARTLTQLVADLLDVGRIVTGKLRLETSPIDLGAVTSTAVETVRPVAQAKGVRLNTHISPIDEPLLGDPARVEQIVWNLVSNAIKFTPRDGTVEARVEARDAWAHITVRDTGEGISPEFLPHLFERFRQQEGTAASRKHGGLGLGLAIVKHLAELHGGRVRAESAGLGRGSTFTVELPLASKPERVLGAGAESSKAAADVTTLGGVRVLLVEDESDTREFVQRVLEESSAEVVSAGSAAEALAVIDEARPDVLVSDVGMPGMDGYALVRELRSREASCNESPVPAVALTAFARSEDRERAFDAGFTEHLTKPIDPATLVTAVARLSRKRNVAAAASHGR